MSGRRTSRVCFCYLPHVLADRHTLTTDPIFLSILNDILYAIVTAKAPTIYETTVKYVLPRLIASIDNTNVNETWVPSSALELIGTLARGAPEAGLGEGFFAAIAPSVFNCLKVAEDRDVLQVRIFTYSSMYCRPEMDM
jgi:importin-9